MGTIKIELDIPDFDNTLDINISLLKDKNGVVKYSSTTTPTPSVSQVNELPTKPEVIEQKPATTTTKKKSSGNLMNSDLF